MGRLSRASTVAALCALASCAVIAGIKKTTDEPDVEESGVSDAAADESQPPPSGDDAGDQLGTDDDASVVEPGDAGFTDDGGDPPPPADAGLCNPTTTFTPSTGATGTVCNAGNVLAGVSGYAGLDYTNNVQKLGLLDGVNVTACIGVTFPKTLQSFVVRTSAVAKACDRACIGSFCGTGHSAAVFAGTSGSYKHVATLTLGTSYADFTIDVDAGTTPNQVVVCRTGWSGERDDVAVYSIFGTCAP
ncbi:MAG TPA: hypothetical protein VIF62_19150 [Labilithrix sp.]|jgi:hypothetical protein